MICHASIDEKGTTVGATPGDQNTKEVCCRTYYNKPWNYLLRCTDATMREKIACAMEKAVANDQIGYSQPHRNDLLKSCRNAGYDPSIAKMPCDCDCSSLVSVACMYAGIPENVLYKSNNCCTTSNIRSSLMSTGKFQTLTDQKYFTTDNYLYRGDILLREPGHVAVNVTDGSAVKKNDTTPITSISASNQKMVDISEFNTITDYAGLAKQMKYVIIRVGRRAGSNGLLVTDKSFEKHIENCLANGMTVGVYFYDQSINENEAKEQAEWVINKIKPYSVKLPIFIDSEATRNHDGRADSLSKEQRTKNIIAFCDRINKANYIGGCYASDSWFKSMLNFDQIKNYVIWVARYSTQKPTISKYDIWQYGSEYYSWAAKNIDTNIIYTDFKTNNVTPTVTPAPTPTPTKITTTETPILLMGKVNINSGTLNVRKTPSTTAPVVQQLNKGVYIQLRGDLGDWYRIDTGYVSKQYIKETHGIVTGDNLRLRSTPDSSLTNNIVTTLAMNTEVIICTAANGWYYILLYDGTTGWVNGQYIKLK